MVNKSAGRPAGGSDARERLIKAAEQRMTSGDPALVTSRGIAADAGVSHTLVNYYFGSLDELLAHALALKVTPSRVLQTAIRPDGSLDADRLARGLVGVWEHPSVGPRLAALARTLAAGTATAPALTGYLERAVLQPLVDALGQERARRAGIAIIGVIFSRYVLRFGLMASMEPPRVADQLARMISVG